MHGGIDGVKVGLQAADDHDIAAFQLGDLSGHFVGDLGVHLDIDHFGAVGFGDQVILQPDAGLDLGAGIIGREDQADLLHFAHARAFDGGHVHGAQQHDAAFGDVDGLHREGEALIALGGQLVLQGGTGAPVDGGDAFFDDVFLGGSDVPGAQVADQREDLIVFHELLHVDETLSAVSAVIIGGVVQVVADAVSALGYAAQHFVDILHVQLVELAVGYADAGDSACFAHDGADLHGSLELDAVFFTGIGVHAGLCHGAESGQGQEHREDESHRQDFFHGVSP